MNKMNFKAQSAQGGFTLIELIVVIVILGIMAATAIPQFVDMGADAREAKMNAAAGAVKSAGSLEYARLLASGGTGAYLTTKSDIESKAGLASTDYTVVAGTAAGTFEIQDAGKTACKFTYTSSDNTTSAVAGC